MSKLSNNAMLAALSQDRALASSVIFAARHPQESPPAHIEIMDRFCSQDELVMVSAFRECGKSTLAEEYLLLEGLFGNFSYAVIFASTYEKACQRLDALKMELTANEKITQLFGVQKKATSVWRENAIELANGVYIEARGWETEVRGLKRGANRPDRMLLDDIETGESVKTKAAVDATLSKIYRELLPALDRVSGKIRIIATPMSEDCLVSRIAANPEWQSMFYPICNGEPMDDTTVALWPSRYDMAWIRKTYKRYESAGQLPSFLQEFMLKAVDSANKPFDVANLVDAAVDPAPWLPKTVLIDPARTANAKTSDRTGYVVVSKLGSKIYVHESGGHYWEPDAIIAACFDLSAKYNGARIAIERNSLDLFLTQPLRSEMLKRGVSLNLKTLLAPSQMNKVDFITGLQPFINASDVVLIGGAGAHAQLVGEVAMFPSGKRDVINSLAYVLRVFSDKPVYDDFGPQHITSNYVPVQNTPLALVFNASGNETAAALCATEGARLVVLADWSSPQDPVEAVGSILAAARSLYPRRPMTVYVPGDVYDQKDRTPLMHAMRVHQLRPVKGSATALSRGELSSLLRTETKGVRLFLVATEAVATCNAMAQGYAYAMSADLQQGGEPERNPARTLMEAIETMANVVYGREKAAPVMFNATNTSGASYLSSAPQRRRV